MAALLAFTTSVFLPGTASSFASDETTVSPLVCPFTSKPNRIIVDIFGFGGTGGFLMGAGNQNPNKIGPISIGVPAGIYTVSWASYDAHAQKGEPNPGQEHEQWYLDVGGYISVDTVDVPWNSDHAQGVLDAKLVVGSDQASVTIVHGGPANKTNSLYAICAALDPLSPPTTTTTTTAPPTTPGIDIQKSTNGHDADTPTGPSITVGDPVTWTYLVTNTGQVDLTGVIVTDDILGPICTIGNLVVDASQTCEITGAATAGRHVNIGTAVDNNGVEPTVTDTDPSHYFGQEVLASATIGDTVWSDENANGFQDSEEKGISGAKVKLTLPDNTTLETMTNVNGLYLFSALGAGEYKVELIVSSIPEPAEGSLMLTTIGRLTVQLLDGQSHLDADFGVLGALPTTGVSADSLALISLILLLTGGIAVLATRPRKNDWADDFELRLVALRDALDS